MISVESDKIPEVAQQIADVEGVSEVYSVAGDVDLIAVVRVKKFDDIADTIAGRLSKVAGALGEGRHPGLLQPTLLVGPIGLDAAQPVDGQSNHHRNHQRVAAEPH